MKNKNLPQLNHQTRAIKGEQAYSVLAKAQGLEKQGKKIIHLEIGQPDFRTPENVSTACVRSIERGQTKYTPTLGLPELRAAIAAYTTKERKTKVTPKMVAVTPSTKMAIYLAMTAILKKGDEVIYPNPGFPIYENMIEFLGCVGKSVPLIEKNNFSFDLDVFSQLLNSKTKLVVLNSPSNPTGGIIPEKDLRVLSAMVKKYDCWIISDEIYSKIVYGADYQSIYSLKGMSERTIIVDGFSKTYSMTGWRLGYAIIPERIEENFENLSVNSFACAASFVQYAGIEALSKKTEPSVKKMVSEFEKRRNFIVKKLNEIPGFHCETPKGAFYAFPNVKKLGIPSQKLADYILEKAGVAIIPGTAFGKYGEGYLRISYATSLQNISEALEKIKTAVQKL